MISKELVKNITDLRTDPISLFNFAKKKASPLYVFNRAEPLGVLFSWEDYEKVVDLMEDAYDLEDLRNARKTSKKLIPWEQMRKNLVDKNL